MNCWVDGGENSELVQIQPEMCFFIAVGENCYVGFFIAQLMQCNRVSPADVRTVRANPAVSGEANKNSKKKKERENRGRAGHLATPRPAAMERWAESGGDKPIREEDDASTRQIQGFPHLGVHTSPRPRNHPICHGTSAVMRFNHCRALCNQLTFTSLTQMHDGYSETSSFGESRVSGSNRKNFVGIKTILGDYH